MKKDKLTAKKKRLIRIASDKSLSRLKKYDLVRVQIVCLTGKERRVLYKEFCRDFDAYNRLKEINDHIAIFPTAIGLMISIAALYSNSRGTENGIQQGVLYVVAGYLAIFLLILMLIVTYREKQLNVTKYLIDIFEEF